MFLLIELSEFQRSQVTQCALSHFDIKEGEFFRIDWQTDKETKGFLE